MKLHIYFKAISAAMAFILCLCTLSACSGDKDTESESSSSQSGTSSSSEEYKGVVTSKFSLEGTRDTTSVTQGTSGSDAVYAYKYKLVPGDFCLVKDNTAVSNIVVAADAPSVVSAAANDLAASIKSMTGAELTVVDDETVTDGNVILVGRSAKTDELGVNIQSGFPDNEGFRVIASKNVLVLAGNDDGGFTGTQYAVTSFLKSIGFGWYGEGSLWTVVPKASTVFAAECDLTSAPSFGSRFTRVNMENPEIAKRWYLGGYNSEVDHKFWSLVPVSKYFGEHPEYFAYSKGTRSTEGKRWWQLCLSNKDVQRIVADECIKFFKENPNYVGVSIGQNDGSGDPNSPDYANWCECDECKKFAADFTEAMMKFSNIIGDLIKDECPGKTVMYYAYFSTFTAPKTTLTAADNALLMLCKQGGTTRFIRNNNLFNSSMGDPQFSDNFNLWKQLGYKHIGIYEWNCPGAADERWKDCFWVQGEVFIDNARWFKENEADFIYIDQGPNSSYERSVDYWDIRWPLWYVNSIAMYDCSLSFEDIMRPACDRLFGKAAEQMYAFYKAMNDANKNCAAENCTWGLPSPSELYTDNYENIIDEAISGALKIAKAQGGEYEQRVQNQYDNWLKNKSFT